MTTLPMPLSQPEQLRALDIARDLARIGVPVFVAEPCSGPDCTTECQEKTQSKGVKVGYHLPTRWQQTRPDPRAVDRWRPGWALCAVGGVICDFLDTDPRNGGKESREALQATGQWPRSYGMAATPSGGVHEIIVPLGVGKGEPVRGVDLQGGAPPDAQGRTHQGFVFLAPMIRASKTDGRPRSYRWLIEPDLEALLAARGTDRSGAHLASLITRKPAAPKHVLHRPAEIFCDFWPAQADKVIADCLAEVTEGAESDWAGFRETLCLRSAYTLGGLVGGGYLTAGDAAARLTAAIEEAGQAPNEDDEAWIETGLRDGMRAPLWVRSRDPEVDPGPLDRPRVLSDCSLPDEFWESRAVLRNIRSAAHARARSADAVLGVVLARLSSLLPGSLRIDTGVGGTVALNFYSILLGIPGAGKTSSANIAEGLFPMMYDSDSVAHPVGSGQGIAAAYGAVVDGEFQQNVTKAFFYADEGAALLAMAKARESTTLATLRAAWMGGTFGSKNATSGLNRRVSGYSLGLWVGLQYAHAAELFSDASVGDGTLQRFVWFNASDLSIPTGRRRDDTPISMGWDLSAAWGAHDVTIPDWLKDEIYDRDVSISRGETVPEPGEEHAGLVRVKTACLLAILDHRVAVDEQDWALSATVLACSNAVAQTVKDAAAQRARAAEASAIAKRHRLATADAEHSEKLDEVKIEKLRRRAIEKTTESPGITHSALVCSLSRDRDAATMAIARAEAAGQLSINVGTHGRGRIVTPKID